MTLHRLDPDHSRPYVVPTRPAVVIPLIVGRDARAAAAYRTLVRSIVCPTCDADPGERCINPVTGIHYLDRVPGHHARARAAAERP